MRTIDSTPPASSPGAKKALWRLALGRTIDVMTAEGVSLTEITVVFNDQAVPAMSGKPTEWRPTAMTQIRKLHCGVPALIGDIAIAEVGGYPVVHASLGNA